MDIRYVCIATAFIGIILLNSLADSTEPLYTDIKSLEKMSEGSYVSVEGVVTKTGRNSWIEDENGKKCMVNGRLKNGSRVRVTGYLSHYYYNPVIRPKKIVGIK